MAILAKKYFTDEVAAFAHLERLLWPMAKFALIAAPLAAPASSMASRARTARSRPGLWKCYSKECRKQFTVRVGTVFEASHIPLHKMLQAVYLLCSSKKGISTTNSTEPWRSTTSRRGFWHTEFEKRCGTALSPPMGGGGKAVEADETYIGKAAGHEKAKGKDHKNIVLTLVERGGSARSFHVEAIGDLLVTVTYCLNQAMLRAIPEAIDELDRPEVRAIILYGEGQAFSAGIDFTSLSNDSGAHGGQGGGPDMQRFRRFVAESQASLNRIESIEKPVIGALHGFVGGLGLELALAAMRASRPPARGSGCPKFA